MAPGQKFDDDAPRTKAEDWVGAEKFLRDREKPRKLESTMTFYIFQASTDSSLFAVTDTNDETRIRKRLKNGHWTLFKSVEETGRPRIGFSESEAKSDIEVRGYHLTSVQISTKESAA